MGEVAALEVRARAAVAAAVSEQRRAAEAQGVEFSDTDQRQLGRMVVRRELEAHTRAALAAGREPIPPAEQQVVADRVLTRVFSPLPELDRFLAMDDVTNIHVLGCRGLVVERLDGTREQLASPFGRDAEVVEAVAQIARRAGTVEKAFTHLSPMLHLALPDGSRLTATGWIGSEPTITIRRHPLVDYDLADLAGLGMMDATVESFLAAVVRARWNILVCGAQDAGKTTLLRALAHAAHPQERLVVLESEPELGLDRFPDRHPHVVALAERPSNMAGQGGVTLADLVWHAKRLSPDRVIVGEVLGAEAVPMLEALSQGVRGSMATIHAESTAGALARLPVYARSEGRDWRTGDVLALAALGIDLVVFVARARDGRRAVAEVRALDRYDPTSEQVLSDAWFTPGPDGRATPAGVIPVAKLDDLVAHGFRPGTMRPTVGSRGGNGNGYGVGARP